jgi:DNA mismatch repair protein MutL
MAIRVLPPRVAALIAAGEVIDRPASVVRELLDNAIDGGATKVEVSVRGSRLERISVIDNGRGMIPEDLDLCLEHHATSKLVDNDVRKVTTLGFRGEALASIAAVSTVRIVSRPKGQDVAFTVVSGAVNRAKARPSAGSEGTRVEVDDLFHNHPARLKFMKSERTERAWVKEVVERAALAHPDVEISLVTGQGRHRYSRPDPVDRMKEVLADDLARDAIVLSARDGAYSAEGLVPLPSAVKGASARQVFMVNGRAVSDRSLSSVVSSVYRTLIGTKETPSVAIHLRLPLDEVDINVHPQKSEIRFLHPDRVGAFLRAAITDTLNASGLKSPAALFELARGLADTRSGDVLSDRSRLPLGRFVAQVDSMYLVGQTTDGIVLIDQHAAHERVILERLKTALHSDLSGSSRIAPPITRLMPSMHAALLAENLETLQDIGFDVILSGDTLVFSGFPSVLDGCDPADLLDRMATAAVDGISGGMVGEALWETLATAACKAAIKAGRSLTPERADILMREIEATPNASQCNHGRPTIAFLRSSDIGKFFDR